MGELTLGETATSADLTLLVVDLSSINGQLSQAGLDPLEVLDYVGERLFLLPEP